MKTWPQTIADTGLPGSPTIAAPFSRPAISGNINPLTGQAVDPALLQRRILAVRYGKSNPHSSVGYYVHPRLAKILSDWIGLPVSRQGTPSGTDS